MGLGRKKGRKLPIIVLASSSSAVAFLEWLMVPLLLSLMARGHRIIIVFGGNGHPEPPTGCSVRLWKPDTSHQRRNILMK